MGSPQTWCRALAPSRRSNAAPTGSRPCRRSARQGRQTTAPLPASSRKCCGTPTPPAAFLPPSALFLHAFRLRSIGHRASEAPHTPHQAHTPSPRHWCQTRSWRRQTVCTSLSTPPGVDCAGTFVKGEIMCSFFNHTLVSIYKSTHFLPFVLKVYEILVPIIPIID